MILTFSNFDIQKIIRLIKENCHQSTKNKLAKYLGRTRPFFPLKKPLNITFFKIKKPQLPQDLFTCKNKLRKLCALYIQSCTNFRTC